MQISIKLDVLDQTLVDIVKEDGSWFVKHQEVKNPISENLMLERMQYKGVYCAEKETVAVVRYASLHQHSDDSLLDGMSKISDIVKHTEYACALTDHGNMYGFLEFYKAMKEAGKKPILGFEAYSENLDGELAGCHLILLAKNNEGYKNLLHLTSEAYSNFYGKPHVTWDMLRKYGNGIIATSACMGGCAQSYLKKGDIEKARTALKEYVKIFGEDFYIEIQRHGINEEDQIMAMMAKMGREMGIKLIATTDSHYTLKEHAHAHELMLCLQTGKTMDDPEHFKFPGSGYHIHTSEEMERLFADIPEALDNTLEIVDKCNVEIQLNEINMPNYDVPAPFVDTIEYFTYLCKEGFKTRFEGKPEYQNVEYRNRFNYELEMIKQMGFCSYFVIVWDYINWARNQNIYVGPGRGSAAGSLCAYCIGITDLDPIKYNLLFERFLNPERVSMPDVDVDFEHSKRELVIDYVTKKYGTENVCRVITFGTMAAKQSVKDMARVLDYPVSVGNTIAKMIPSEVDMTIQKALDKNPDFANAYQNDPTTKTIIDYCKVVEGCKRHSSVHACAVLIAPQPVENFLPVSIQTDDETGDKFVTSQVVGPECEELSLLKMDFLGLKNMTVIHDVIDNIKTTRGIDMIYQDIPLNDRATYEMLRDGFTGGVFQLESEGMTSVVTRMLSDLDDLPDDRLDECFERMIAAVALYRPGPMDFIDEYITGMHDPDMIHYDTPEIESVLKPTYGVIVYQEQVIQIVQKLAGYTVGRADIVRRAVAKKKKKDMDAERVVFLYGNQEAYARGKDKALVPGCVKNGIPEHVAIAIWDKMEKFAAYAFNRSHAACYAFIAILTAYMRCHWTAEFYAAMCNAFALTPDKLKAYLVQATKANIKILLPDINLSQNGFTSDDGKNVRFGLIGLKGVKGSSVKILEERDRNGAFKSVQDLYERLVKAGSKLNKTALEALTWSGSLNCFGHNKHSIMEAWSEIIQISERKNKMNDSGQCCLFAETYFDVKIKSLSEYPEEELMKQENEFLGFYLTKHPVDSLYDFLSGNDEYTLLPDLPVLQDGEERQIKTIGLISNTKRLFTRKTQEEMYTFVINDRFSSIKCTVFPKRVAANRHHIYDGNIVVLSGPYAKDENFGNQIKVEEILSKNQIKARITTVCVEIKNKREQDKIFEFAKSNPGNTPVVLECNGKKYYPKMKASITTSSLDYLKTNFAQVSCL